MRIVHLHTTSHPWSILNRVTNLSKSLNDLGHDSKHFYIRSIKEVPECDIIHVHTLAALPSAEKYLQRKKWVIEIVSQRSIKHIPEIIKEASLCILKNPRLKFKENPRKYYIPNGVDTTIFSPRIRIGWVGNKKESNKIYKGVPLIEEAVEKLKIKYPDLDIQMVFDDSNYPSKILTHQEVSAYYRTLDVSVCASEAEGCSNTILESLACGIPVVTTPVGIYKELEHMPFVTVCERSVEGINKALETVLRAKIETCLEIGFVYSWMAIAKEYERAYNVALGNA